MRKRSLATAVIAVLAVSACKGNDRTMNDDLAKDVALAANQNGLALAPSNGLQTVVSAEEQSPQARSKMAPSTRSTRATPHRTPHRDRVPAHHATEVASVSAPAPEEAPAPSPAPAPQPVVTEPAPAVDVPVAESPRPHPVDVGSSAGSGTVDAGRSGGGISIGNVIGIVLGGAILRGGVMDGDHCDPRGHRGGATNDRIPPTAHGRF